jgi:hypothetical protein
VKFDFIAAKEVAFAVISACTPPTSDSALPASPNTKLDLSTDGGEASQDPFLATSDPCGAGQDGSAAWPPEEGDGATTLMRLRDLGLPGPGVHATRAEVLFRWWPAVSGREYETTFPEKLKTTPHKKTVLLDDPRVIEPLWKDYLLVRTSSEHTYDIGCVDDARIMVRFCTTEPAERWFAAGASCDVLMVTENRKLHIKNGQVLRDMADAIGVTAQMEAAVPDIFR